MFQAISPPVATVSTDPGNARATRRSPRSHRIAVTKLPDQWESSRDLLSLLGGRWKLDVHAELSQGGRRYQDLVDALDGVSNKVLTETLRRAECDGLILRRVDPHRLALM
jgi:DNA-binding HxlR family transcriptional regulator